MITYTSKIKECENLISHSTEPPGGRVAVWVGCIRKKKPTKMAVVKQKKLVTHYITRG